MKIDILTLFPNMIEGYINESIIKRARNNNLVEINLINFRDYSTLPHNQVDDTPYGGGSGMVLMCDPIFRCIEAIKKENSHIILMSPSGKTYNQKKAYELSKKYEHLIIICGHYEGVDERIKTIIDEEISIGDYILTGGELAASILIDSITRLIPNVIDAKSLENESFNNNLLDYPVYTKPREYKGLKVPEVLLSGDHKKIEEYRKKMQYEKTKSNRKDLLGVD